MKRYESYKPSGISWIGEIPSHWEVLDVSRLFNFQRGINFTKDLFCDSGEPVISYGQVHSKKNYGYTLNKEIIKYIPKNLTVGKNNAKCEFGDIIFADTSEDLAGCGNCIYIDDNNGIYAGYHTFLIKPKNQIVSQYFPFLFLSKQWRNQITENCTEVKVFSITQSILRRCKILIPPIEEQKKIVEYLSTKTSLIDAQQSAREKEIRLLEELKQAEIANVITRGLNPDVPMKDSGIPWISKIPSHWEEKKAKYLFIRHNRIVQEDDDVITCFRDGQVTLRKNRRTTGFTESFKEYGYQGIRKGDLVIHQMDAFAGSTGISDSDGKGTPVYIVCTPANANIYNPFFGHVIRYMGLNGYIMSLYKGIRERSSNFSYDVFSQQYLPIPPIEEQRAIVEYIEQKNKAINDMIANLRAEIDFLTEYKQRLIADAVTGQIKID